jgi:plasmid stability protein
MALKVTQGGTKALLLRNLSLATHWKLESWAKRKKLGKEDAAEKILRDALRSEKLDLENE